MFPGTLSLSMSALNKPHQTHGALRCLQSKSNRGRTNITEYDIFFLLRDEGEYIIRPVPLVEVKLADYNQIATGLRNPTSINIDTLTLLVLLLMQKYVRSR